ncbi:unnamed protein product [Closterium sp. Naga37s-1]|nr:unnamed protein product [Closterium sp. Naga37s-1]
MHRMVSPFYAQPCLITSKNVYFSSWLASGQPYPRLTRASHEFTPVPGWAVASAAAPASEAAMACAVAMQPSTEALSYRIGGMLGILVSSIIGFSLPFLLRGRHKTLLFFFRAMAAGIVLAVAIVHIFPGAQEALSNPCLDLSSSPFPWAPCAGSKCVDSTCTDAKCVDAKCLAKCCETKCPACPDCALDVRPGEEEKAAMKTGKAVEWEEQEGREESEERQMREAVALSSLRAVAYTLEMGIIFHSIFIGIALGANHDSAEIKGLAIALVFHQGFEGISLGTAIAPCRFSLLKTLCMGLLFAFTTPLGVAIGLAVQSSYNSNSQAALATEGAFNAVSAGILIYNGLVDLLVPTFDEHDENTPKDPVAYFFGFVFLFLGAGAMSLLAIWA